MASNKEQVMTIGATSVEEQLVQMSEAIARMIKTAEEKNLQTARLINRLEAQQGVKAKPSSLPTKRTEEVFNPSAYELMSKAGHDFASSSNIGKKSPNTVNDKDRDLTETQKKLEEHDHKVDNNKAGLGFTPNAPVKISSKAENASAQHISLSVEQNQEEPQPPLRVSVFDRLNHSKPRRSALDRIGRQDRTSVFKRLNMPTPQGSVFKRLSKPKKQSSEAKSPPRRSALERLEETKKPSRKRKTTPKEENRQATLEVDTKRPPKVRRRIIIHAGQSSRQQAQVDGAEEEVQNVFPITIQEDKKDEIPEEDVTSGSFNSKSSPQPLGACRKSSEVEGWTHVTPKELHEKHAFPPQVHQSEKGQSSSHPPRKQCESIEDEEISTQRSSMRDLFFLRKLFNYSVKAPCYENCEEHLSNIASKKLDKQQPSRPQVHQLERGQHSSCEPPEQSESVGDNEFSTQKSSVPITMCDLFPEDFFNYSVKAPCYEDCEECLSKNA